MVGQVNTDVKKIVGLRRAAIQPIELQYGHEAGANGQCSTVRKRPEAKPRGARTAARA